MPLNCPEILPLVILLISIRLSSALLKLPYAAVNWEAVTKEFSLLYFLFERAESARVLID
jgi:hypothetical protein